MDQPDELKKDGPLLWSPGTGTDVWEMFCACVAGDLTIVERLIGKDPSLARCSYAYRTPLYFVVRENRVKEAFVRLLLRYQPDLPQRVVFPGWLVCGKTRELNELLLSHGMNPSQRDWLGVTPLHQLARRGDVEMAEWLSTTAPISWHATKTFARRL